MASAFENRSASRHFDSPQQEAWLNLWRTYDRLRAAEEELFARYDFLAAPVVDEHRAILTAYAARDLEAATKLLRDHILNAGNALEGLLLVRGNHPPLG